MVSLLSLIGIAAVVMLVAIFVAWRRGLTLKDARADALAALLMSLGAMILADIFFVLSYPLDSPSLWRELGSVALMASPLACTAALRVRSRRTMPRALIGSGVALVAVVLWLGAHLKGVRGGWTAREVGVTTGAAAATVASAACLGWWSGRGRHRGRSESIVDRARGHV